jgi:general stress protein 26
MSALHPTLGSPAEAPEHLVELLRKFDTAMLVTRPRSGALRGRPMAVAEVEPDGTLWFLTSASSPKAQELGDDSRAMVTMQKAQQFVSLNGNMELIHDRAKIEELWKVTDAAWFSGKEDPDIVLLRFSPFDAEYWDNAGSRGLKYAFAIAKAVARGVPMGPTATVPAAHGKVAL